MARASKLYIAITEEPDMSHIGGWTVKHEAQRWLHLNPNRAKWIVILHDNRPGTLPTYVKVEEFLAS